jgi:hypothetical protein
MAVKASTKHPYAAIEHRVIDSNAYAALTFSARSLLVLLTRQLSKDNNGHLQATYSYLRPYGFSENTISRGIAELVSAGIIYRTRAGGYQQGPAKYAVTWLALTKNTEGLFLAGFKPCAWRDWTMSNGKTPHPKVRAANRKNGEWTDATAPKFAVSPPPKLGDIELMPCRGDVSAVQRSSSAKRNRRPPPSSPLAIRLAYTADRPPLRLVA